MNSPNLSIPAKSVTDHGQLSGLGDDDHSIYILVNGSRALTANWDAGSFQIRAETFQSDVATGTAPLIVASTTVVTNLNADLLDGQHAAAFAAAVHTHAASAITSGTLVHERGGLEADVSAGDGFVQIKAGATTVIKSNHAATAAPGVGNDNTQGYAVGSRWIDTTNDAEYVCLDASTGAAVWTETTGGDYGGGGSFDIDALTEETDPDPTADYVAIYSATAGAHRKTLPLDLVEGLSIANLGDVVITSPAPGEVLLFVADEWINQTLAEAGISAVGHTHDLAEVLTAGGDAEGNDVDNLGLLNFDAATELTIAGDAITVTQSVHRVDTESNAAADDLATINGGAEGDFLLLYPEAAGRVVTIKHGVGNIVTSSGADFEIPADGYALLYRDASNWRVNDPTGGDYGGGGGGGFTNLGNPNSVAGILTIASGSVTITQSAHFIEAETGTSDTLDEIQGGTDGTFLIIAPVNGETITVSHLGGSGNDQISLANEVDVILGNPSDVLTLFRYGNGLESNWREAARSATVEDVP